MFSHFALPLSKNRNTVHFAKYKSNKYYMKNFNRGNTSRGRDDRGDRRERPTMHQAVCDDCGRSCEVPFRPSGDKPVYCNSCFGREESNSGDDRRGGDRRGGGERSARFDRFDRRGGDRREAPRMHKATCDECGNLCEVPFKPSGDKPVYCNGCFGKGDNSSSGKSNQSGLKHDEINAKLDTIIILLQRLLPDKGSQKNAKSDNSAGASENAEGESVKEKKAVIVNKVVLKKAAKKAPVKKAVKKPAAKKKTK